MSTLEAGDQEILRDAVRRFLADAAPTSWVRSRLDLPEGSDAAVDAGLAELGLTGALLPERYGGAALTLAQLGGALEELGRAVFPGPLHSSAVLATSLLLATEDDACLAEWGPALARGERRLTAVLDADARAAIGSSTRTTARARAGHVVLDGAVRPVLDAHGADGLLVLAREGTEPGRPSVFLVRPGAEGLAIVPFESVDGTRKLSSIRLAATPAQRVGRPLDGDALDRAIDAATAALCADAVGAADRVHELAVAHAKERIQFDRPIGSFQAVQHRLVDMLCDLELARAATGAALHAIDAGDPRARTRAVSRAKAFASEALPRVGAGAIQVFGGIGFTWETDVHLYYKRLLSFSQLFGDARTHLDRFADCALDAQRPAS